MFFIADINAKEKIRSMRMCLILIFVFCLVDGNLLFAQVSMFRGSPSHTASESSSAELTFAEEAWSFCYEE